MRLTRALVVRHGIGSSPGRRRVVRQVCRYVLGGASAIFVVSLVAAAVAPRHACCGESKGEDTKIKVRKYAHEAYPAWAVEHPDRACPDRLSDLNVYTNDQSASATRDHWGSPLVMLCGANLPAGAKGLVVASSGEDGELGTADDIWSHE